MVQGIGNNTVVQIAMVVRDVEKSAQAWAEVLGVDTPSWKLTNPAADTNILYKGKTTDARAKLAFLNLGSVNLELIEPVDKPSVWQEYLDEHGDSVHHIAFKVDDMAKTVLHLEGKGLQTAQTGDFTGGEYVYMDGQEKLGLFIELLGRK